MIQSLLTNLCAVEIDPANPLMLTPLEFAQFLGDVVNMSIIFFASVKALLV